MTKIDPDSSPDSHRLPHNPALAANHNFAESMTTSSLLTLTILVEGGLLAVALALGWWLKIPFWEDIVSSSDAWGWAILWTLPLVAIFIALVETSWRATARVKQDLTQFVVHLKGCSTGHLLFMSVMAGLGEEALFRGILLPWAAGYIGIPGALVLTSILFGLAHFISKEYMIGTTIIGMFLGGLYIWHDNLLVPMAVHGIYDFIALIYVVKIRPIAPSFPSKEA